jgi:hypothetical protein
MACCSFYYIVTKEAIMANTAAKLTNKQESVIRAYAAIHGRHWKNRLGAGWETHDFRIDGTDDELKTLMGLRGMPFVWELLDAVALG